MSDNFYSSYKGLGGSGGGGSGTVTSVGLALPASVFTVSGSPVTTTGTLTGSLINQSQNTVFAGPTAGSGAPTFRLLVAGDIPSLSYANLTLSNLSTTAINTDLISSPANTFNLGSSSNPWLYSYVNQLRDASNTVVLHVPLRQLRDTSSNPVLTWSGANPDLNAHRLINVVDPVGAQDAATKNYVDTNSGTAITALTGDVAATGPGSVSAIIQTNVVSNSKLAQMPTLTIKGNNTGGTANALDLTVSQVNTMLGNITTLSAVGASPNANAATIAGNTLNFQPFNSTNPGVVTASGGGTTNFLRADGAWSPAGTGTVTSVTASSPLTSSGGTTPNIAFSTQSANTILAGPTSGGASAPTFRALVSTDIPSLAYANQTLSNLTTTAINADLIPDSDIGRNLGTFSTRWNTLYVGIVRDSSNVNVLNAETRILYDGNGSSSIEFGGTGNAPVSLKANTGTRPLNFYDGSNTNFVTIKAPTSVTSTYSLILPTAQASGAQFLQNNGSGTLSWVTGNAGTVTSVTGSGNIASSGGTTPNITFTGTLPSSNGGTGVSNSFNLTIGGTSSINGTFSGTSSGTNTGDQTITLTGDVTGSGTGSFATTLSTVNGNVGTFGSSTSIPTFTVNAKGLITAASGNAVIAPAGTLTGTTLASNVVTSSLTSLGTQSAALNMGSHLINNVTDPASAQDAATKAYVDNVAAGINPAVAVQAATTAASDTSGFTYNNGVSGIGATFTGTVNTPVIIDGFTFTTLGQRLLVKNDTQSPSGAFNGVYYVTQVQTAILAPILTRALDYDQPSDINNTGAIPVINGTVNNTTQWVLTSLVATVGTDPLTFTRFARNPADYLLKANNLSDVSSPSTSFNNISPMTTGGDLIYGGASGAGTRLANGSVGQYLVSGGGTSAPSWSTVTPNGFAFFTSSQVNTNSTAVASTGFSTFSNSPAFTVTPTTTGIYKIYAGAPLYQQTTGRVGSARIFNTSGSATLLAESVGLIFNGGSSIMTTAFIQSTYTLTAGNTYVFDIQGRNDTGAGSLVLDTTDGPSPFYMFGELAG